MLYLMRGGTCSQQYRVTCLVKFDDCQLSLSSNRDDCVEVFSLSSESGWIQRSSQFNCREGHDDTGCALLCTFSKCLNDSGNVGFLEERDNVVSN